MPFILQVERSNLWPKRIQYAAFSAHEKPTKGDYVDCGSVLVVKVEVRRPLQNSVLYPAGPFQRVVYRFQYSNADLLQRIAQLIIKINSEALGTPSQKPEPPESGDVCACERTRVNWCVMRWVCVRASCVRPLYVCVCVFAILLARTEIVCNKCVYVRACHSP